MSIVWYTGRRPVADKHTQGESDVRPLQREPDANALQSWCQVCFSRPARVRVLDTHPKAMAEGVESPGIDVCDECYVKCYAKGEEKSIAG